MRASIKALSFLGYTPKKMVSLFVVGLDYLNSPRKGNGISHTQTLYNEGNNAIDRIIQHLKLTLAAERPPPPQARPQLAMAAEERTEYL